MACSSAPPVICAPSSDTTPSSYPLPPSAQTYEVEVLSPAEEVEGAECDLATACAIFVFGDRVAWESAWMRSGQKSQSPLRAAVFLVRRVVTRRSASFRSVQWSAHEEGSTRPEYVRRDGARCRRTASITSCFEHPKGLLVYVCPCRLLRRICYFLESAAPSARRISTMRMPVSGRPLRGEHVTRQGGGGPFAVLPNNKPGRFQRGGPLVCGHTASVLDFDFNPFHEQARIAWPGRMFCANQA